MEWFRTYMEAKFSSGGIGGRWPIAGHDLLRRAPVDCHIPRFSPIFVKSNLLDRRRHNYACPYWFLLVREVRGGLGGRIRWPCAWLGRHRRWGTAFDGVPKRWRRGRVVRCH